MIIHVELMEQTVKSKSSLCGNSDVIHACLLNDLYQSQQIQQQHPIIIMDRQH